MDFITKDHRATQTNIFEDLKWPYSLVSYWYNCFKEHYITNNP